ncbi:hypothetical protein Bhyg_09137, partial [Pseudolycoriella hygida]
RFYELYPQPLVCKVLDSKIVFNYTCITKEVNRTYHQNSREIIFNPGVKLTNYYIDVRVLRKFGSVFRQILEIDQDMCEFTKGISSRDSSMLAKIMNKDGRRKYGNMFEPCPLVGTRYEKEAVIDYGKMPDVVPAGEYRVDIFGYTIISGKKNQFILTQCFTNVIPKSTKKG